MADKKKNSSKKASTKPARADYDDYEEDDDANFATTVKGVIAVMVTLMLVIIVLMYTARSMFVLEGNEVETILGSITSTMPTVYDSPEVPAENNEETKKATTTTKPANGGGETTTTKLGNTTQYRCTSAVYLHPEPSAESENLLVIPLGAVVEVQKEEYGWYYLDYNGTIGWAYGSFFTINQ